MTKKEKDESRFESRPGYSNISEEIPVRYSYDCRLVFENFSRNHPRRARILEDYFG